MIRKNTCGAITVEACITVTLFMLLMFILLGFFMMFMAYNSVAHALLQTSDSLAMDAWQVSKLQIDGGFPDEVGAIISNLVAEGLGSEENNPYYVSEQKWYSDSALLEDAVSKRFLGYFAGGNPSAAKRYIKAVNIENSDALDWIGSFDFSESKIINGDLYVIVKYKLNYMFKIWGLENGADIKQTAVSHLWMENSGSVNLLPD